MSTFLRAKQADLFYPTGEVVAAAQRGQLVKILFHSSFALLNLDTLTQDTATGRFFGPLAMKSQGFVACPDPILSTNVVEVGRSMFRFHTLQEMLGNHHHLLRVFHFCFRFNMAVVK